MKILVTGATGYVGGRLVPRLLALGHQVRVLARDPERVQLRPWSERVEIVRGDVLDPESLGAAVRDIELAYYLIHSMYAGHAYPRLDRQGAEHFGRAAAEAGVARIVYLGAILPTDQPSAHLRSRAEVGAVLAGHAPTLELRAGPIIGSGSASFEMCRYLTERLPALPAPPWIDVPVRPLAIRTALELLLAASEPLDALGEPFTGVMDVGGEAVTFRQMMKTYAQVRDLRPRLFVPSPILPARVAAYGVGLLTPITNDLADPLIRGMRFPILGDLSAMRARVPHIHPIGYRRAVDLALRRITERDVETRWTGSLSSSASYTLDDREGMITEQQSRVVRVSVERAFRAACRLGGERGWGAWDWAWRARGLLDQAVGGPGVRRGRRDADAILPGEVLDFWRVEAIEPPHRILLRAEFKLPGRAWLQLEILPHRDGAEIVQTALFAPRGLAGLAYWWALYPIHLPVFAGLLDQIEADALDDTTAAEALP